MPDQYFSPHQAAQQLGISVHTVRRWCNEFAPHLSPSASPAQGSTRRLSSADLQVLQEVRRLRDEQGLTSAQINERLQGLVIGSASLEPAQAPQPPALTPSPLPPVILETVQGIEGRLKALESRSQRFDTIYLMAFAFGLGLVIGLAICLF